jgi:hypothetical protein
VGLIPDRLQLGNAALQHRVGEIGDAVLDRVVEDRLLVGFQHSEPGCEILRMVGTWRVGDAQVGAEEGGYELGDSS